MKYVNVSTSKIAEYDSFMGMYYVKGEHYADGPMIPYSRVEIEESEKWSKIENE